MELLPLPFAISGSTTLNGRIELDDPEVGMVAIPIGAFAQGPIGISAQGKDVAGIAQVTTIQTLPDTEGSLNSAYFLISGPGSPYYFWFSTNGVGVDPEVPERNGVNVDLPAGNSTAAQVATATAAALTASGSGMLFTASAVGDLITVTCQQPGAPYSGENASDVDTGFTIITTVHGGDGLSVDLFGTCSPISAITSDDAITVALSDFANIGATAVLGKVDIPLTAIIISVTDAGGSFIMDVKVPGSALP